MGYNGWGIQRLGIHTTVADTRNGRGYNGWDTTVGNTTVGDAMAGDTMVEETTVRIQWLEIPVQ